MVKFAHFLKAFLAIAKALPVRAGFDVTSLGERLLARSIATILKNGSIAMV